MFDKPYRNGTSDVAALMIGIFCAAVCLLFLSRINEYAPLRNDGASVEGRWIDGFVQPQTDQFQAIYRFEIEGQIFRGRQILSPDDYGGDGQPVWVLYWPENPKLSRALSGEAIKAGDALGLAIALTGLFLSIQHIIAYYREQTSWALFLRRQLRRLV